MKKTKTLAILCGSKILSIVSFLFLFNQVAFCQLYPLPEVGTLAGQAEHVQESPEPGLLFYLSGENQFRADFAAGGQDAPNFLNGVKIIEDGAKGKAFEAADDQLLSYWAPGNVYAQRGTLSFFWRSRYPVGPTPFPVFRVAFADNTSWDMVWLRIDYNGSGFDAFVTDVGLTRTRVSWYTDDFPAADKWTHIAFSWDETEGIKLYINGELVEKKSIEGSVYDTGLDQFGPHSRIISPYQVQSFFNFMRGGDIDELRIYDRQLSDENIAQLFKGEVPEKIPALKRNLEERRWRKEWWTRNGWNLPNDPPALLPSKNTSIKKVEIHEAYDVKRWFWKANDGIRETTWPGVYNMSRLPGRYDYFVLPDWDCYSTSGQTIKFQLPDEPWNHVEIWGKAWGQLTLEKEHDYDNTFAVRRKDQVKSFHQLKASEKGGKLRFDNALIEEPIGEFGVYNISEGKAPESGISEVFYASPLLNQDLETSVKPVEAFIRGRYPKDEQNIMVAGKNEVNASKTGGNDDRLPVVHIIISYGNYPDETLDGIQIELPGLPVEPTHGELYPVNIRVKDPLWQMRDLADFSFSVKPNTPQTLWIDTRDRLLPDNGALYISIAGAGYGLNPKTLTNMPVKIIYKEKQHGVAEHLADRITQLRDIYGFIIEERMIDPRLNLYNRFAADHADILKADPDNFLAQAYFFAYTRDVKNRPEYKVHLGPNEIPRWAFLQTEYMQRIANIVDYYIDERQIGNGEFGGGLSDDDDFTNILAGAALLGIEPEKIRKSMELFMEGYYDYNRDSYDAALKQRSLPLFTNGLATINADLLHAYEEGIQAVGQMMLLEYGNPLYFNRGMETSKRVLDDLTQFAPDGHRYFRSRNYGGTTMSLEDPWQWSGAYSYNVLHPAYFVQQYNRNPAVQKLVVELADGLLAKRDSDGTFYTDIHFTTGEVRGRPGLQGTWQVMYAAYVATGNQKYLEPIRERVNFSNSFEEELVENRYSEKIKDLASQEFINTEGSVWIDRVAAQFNDLQTDRLGGVAVSRIHNVYPQNFVSWKNENPASLKSLASFVLKADSSQINILAYNLEEDEIASLLTIWKIIPGKWKIIQGIDNNDDRIPDSDLNENTIYLEKGSDIKLKFVSRKNTILQLSLLEPSDDNPGNLPDLAINKRWVKIEKEKISVRVFSQGAVSSPQTVLELRDSNGMKITSIAIPAMEAPLDLIPKWTEVKIEVPASFDLSHGSLVLDPEQKMKQITRRNTRVEW